MAPLSYTRWADAGRNWKILGRSSTGVDDLNADDVVTFTLTSATVIKLDGITCPHLPLPAPAHDAREWKNRDCSPASGTSNKVVGTTSSGRNFEVESSEVTDEEGKKHNVLTCRVILPPAKDKIEPISTIAESTGGGVCWTAEDG